MTNLTQNKGDNVKLVKYHANLTPDNLVEVESEDIKNSLQTFSLIEKIKIFFSSPRNEGTNQKNKKNCLSEMFGSLRRNDIPSLMY